MGFEGVLVEDGNEAVGFASIIGLLGYSLVWKADSFKDLGFSSLFRLKSHQAISLPIHGRH